MNLRNIGLKETHRLILDSGNKEIVRTNILNLYWKNTKDHFQLKTLYSTFLCSSGDHSGTELLKWHS